jgi:hypothetical protein
MTKLMVDVPAGAVDSKLATELRQLRSKLTRRDARIKSLEYQMELTKGTVLAIKRVQDCIKENFPDLEEW